MHNVARLDKSLTGLPLSLNHGRGSKTVAMNLSWLTGLCRARDILPRGCAWKIGNGRPYILRVGVTDGYKVKFWSSNLM